MTSAYSCSVPGVLPMPPGFRYREVFLRGKPLHDRYDSFHIRHPNMDIGHRAKIFSPFDALTGFSDAIAGTEQQYTERTEPDETEKARLDQRLALLHRLTANSRMAKRNAVTVSVTWFVPCEDRNHLAFRILGRYLTRTGTVRRVDPEIGRTLTLDETVIPFSDIIDIRYAGPGEDLFSEADGCESFFSMEA